MITLICGLPGHGKTLYAVSRVAADAQRDGRPVYYHGIPECTVDGWKPLEDARMWHTLPQRSVVVIDEAHQVFPQRGPGGIPPEHVGMTAVVRRLGIDLVLITQDGNSIDHFVRRRCGRYLHVWRAMGLERSTVWEFGRFCDWEDKDARVGAVRAPFNFPRASYALYKSAEVHTVKRRVPAKAFFIPFLVVALAVLGVVLYRALFGGVENSTKAVVSKVESLTKGKDVVGKGALVASGGDKVLSTEDYLKRRVPRLVDLPESAPLYDGLAVPATFPQVAGCVSTAGRCSCYSQQGTRLRGVSDATCTAFVAYGSFNHYRSAVGDDRSLEAASRSRSGITDVAATPRAQSTHTPSLAEQPFSGVTRGGSLEWAHSEPARSVFPERESGGRAQRAPAPR